LAGKIVSGRITGCAVALAPC